MKLINKQNLISITCASLLYVMMQPYFVWGINLTYLELLMLGIFLLNCRTRNASEILLMVFFCPSLLIIPVHKESNLFGIIKIVLLGTIPFLKLNFFERIYYYFLRIYTTILIISFTIWLLILVGVSIPNQQIEPLNTLKVWDTYIQYPFLIVIIKMNSILDSFRFCCVFDEPGVVGTINLILLFINKFNLKKYYNIFLFVTGLVSFSLFFFIGVITFFIIKIFLNKLKLRYKIAYIFGLLLFIGFILSNEVANNMVGNRLEYDKSKRSIVGDNRATDDLIRHIDAIRGTSVYWWGEDPKIASQYDGSAGYRNEVLRYGAVYVFSFILFFLLYSKYYSKNDRQLLITFIILFIMCLYQRPSILSPVYIFLYSCVTRLNYLNSQKNEFQ